MSRLPAPDWNGVLAVDKPAGWTSHDVVAKFRGFFRLKKVGHGGTLDPSATGLLLLLIGRGTKISDEIMGGDKAYEGLMRLGATTSTQDADGELLEEHDASHITEEQVAAQIKSMQGDQMQMPPMVSAIKINGTPLYKMARKGKTVARDPRFIHVYQFRLNRFESPDAYFTVRSTKGTYVRTLCHDAGQALGCGAHLVQLRRLASGPFHVNEALPLEELLALDPTELEARIISIAEARRREQEPR